MTSSLPVVLGIDPGARQIGVSIFRGEELIYYAVRTIKGHNNRETLTKTRKIIKDLLADYGITHVALEKVVFVQQHRSFLKIVFEEIRSFLKKQKRPVLEYSPTAVRKAICTDERPTRRNTATKLARHYPELDRYSNVPKIWQKKYYALLLDAVAVGLVCAKDVMETDRT